MVLIVARMYLGLQDPKSLAQYVVDAAGGCVAVPRSDLVSCLTTDACGSWIGRGICAGSILWVLPELAAGAGAPAPGYPPFWAGWAMGAPGYGAWVGAPGYGACVGEPTGAPPMLPGGAPIGGGGPPREGPPLKLCAWPG